MIQSNHWLLMLLLSTGFCTFSCVSHQELISLNGSVKGLPDALLSGPDTFSLEVQENYKIKPYDLLLITLNTLGESTEQFLREQFSSSQSFNQNNGFQPNAMYYRSYEVDHNGFVHLPIVDSINVLGLTTGEIRRALDKAFAPYIKYATSRVKLANMRINILGEVKNPGTQFLYNNQTNILEALSLAGDFTDFANRKKVKLIRKTPKGRKSVTLNLNESDFISGPYFYIRPDDIIYVEPIKSKAFDVGSNSVGIVLSVISTAALIANIILRGGN